MEMQKGLVQVLLHDRDSFPGALSFTPLIWEENVATTLVLHL